MLNFLLPAHVKKGKQLLKGVKKFIHYHSDLIAPEKMAELETAREGYAAVLETRDKDKLEEEEKRLMKVCEKAVPNYKHDSIRENVEVIIVAIIVALGIRSYIVQPFKIPTASMQPTLNGVIGRPMPVAEPMPNIFGKVWDFVWRGGNYTELKAPESTGKLYITAIEQQSFAVLASRTIVRFSNGESTWCYAPARQLFGDLWLPENAGKPSFDLPPTDSFVRPFYNPSEPQQSQVQVFEVKPGAVLARGRIDTGDQVLVDKVSYNFRQPNRGEVFVFSTKNIRKIEAQLPPGTESQHYIKRLVGVPNDVVEVAPPKMYINGAEATEFGMQRVMASEGNPDHNTKINLYHGYTYPNSPASNYEIESGPGKKDGEDSIIYRLHDKQYMACGDNSGNSFDSRYWGVVPQENLVGRALFVYWPFSPHAGLIK